jgi:hypothetical protein
VLIDHQAAKATVHYQLAEKIKKTGFVKAHDFSHARKANRMNSFCP